jgi:cobalamin biosynthesis protein CbiG
LPYESTHGNLSSTLRERWADVEGFVLMAAVGACVRIVAPLLADKIVDPAVVCVDDAGRYAIALIGGHSAGANDLAREVAALLDAEAVITTATDSTGTVAIDELSRSPTCSAGRSLLPSRASWRPSRPQATRPHVSSSPTSS